MINIGESTVPLLLAIARPGGVRGAARLFHVLRPHQRRLSRRHHADGDADPVQLDQFDRRPRIPHRHGAARRLQRHPRHSAAQRAVRQGLAGRSRGHVLPFDRFAARRLFRPCGRCWRAASAASSSASARTSGAPSCWATIRAPTSSRPSPSARRSPGYAGCLFANWGAFVSPTIFGLAQSAQIIIWVIVGGRGTLIGPILGCVGIQWLTAALGANAPSGDGGLGGLLGNAPLDPRRDPDRPSCCWCPRGWCRRSADLGAACSRAAAQPAERGSR